MTRRSLLCAFVAAFATFALAVAEASAQSAAQGTAEYEPRVGQPGKDVVWVPTPQSLVDKMLDMAKVKPDDVVIDLGSGDGRTVITAAKRGARAHGIEYNPDMVELAKRNAEKEGVGGRATFEKADIFASDYSKATVITLFLLTDLNLKLRPTLLELAPGTRVVSNAWKMGDWEPDEVGRADDCGGWCTAYLWIVPAKVAGKWKLGSGELALRQTYQAIEGTLTANRKSIPVRGRLHGADIAFSAGGREYKGRVDGASMNGRVGSDTWKATR